METFSIDFAETPFPYSSSWTDELEGGGVLYRESFVRLFLHV